uniref:ribbon-helix-helix protein, CopG family n=1 Tax=Ningiella ruwaisensis TaxID=2364274 RepID=UPI00109FA33E|nr:ribbon-helix-helix protein, CopG family [Ningiella ruwaisensis]
METRIQFRIDKELKSLAQKMAQRQGRSLSDACRQLIEDLASQQREYEQNNDWYAMQVKEAFAKYERGNSRILSHEKANARMAQFKTDFQN